MAAHSCSAVGTEGRRGRDALAVSALVLLGAILRGRGLDGGLWLDEIITLVKFIRRPLTEIVTAVPSPNQHALYSILAHASVTLLGEAPWTLRLPAYLFGLACIPALYSLGRAVTTRREALLASALLTVSYHHVWFSQNARGYTGLLCCTLLTTILLMRGLEESPSPSSRVWWVVYAAAAALGMYTHLTMAFTVAAHVLICAVLLLERRRAEQLASARMRWQPFTLAFALTAMLTLLFYAPVLPQVLRSYAHPPRQAATATWDWTFAEAVRGLRIGMGATGVLAAAALAAAGAWSYLRLRRLVLALFVLPGLLVGGAVVLLGWPVRPRFFFFLLGFAALMVVRGATVLGGTLARMLRPLGGPAPAEATLATMLVAFLLAASALALGRNYRFPKQDFDAAIRFVESVHADGEPIATTSLGAREIYQAYYRKQWPVIENAEDFRRIRSQGQRVWLIYTLPNVVAALSPDVMAAVRRDCVPVRVFPGTVGDGDIVVCVASPLAPLQNATRPARSAGRE